MTARRAADVLVACLEAGGAERLLAVSAVKTRGHGAALACDVPSLVVPAIDHSRPDEPCEQSVVRA